MAASSVSLKIEQGATFERKIVYKAGTPAVPVDLTGYTARMQVRAKVASPAVLLSLTTENGGIALGGATGAITLSISAMATAAIAWTSGVYDLELVSPTGFVRRLMKGAVLVSPEVTRV